MKFDIYPDAKYEVVNDRTTFLHSLPKGGNICELGVYKGKFAYWYCNILQPKEYIGIDVWWTVFGDKFPWKSRIDGPSFTPKIAYEKAVAKLKSFPQAKLIVGDSVQTLNTFPDKYFDIVYIDSSHEYDKTIEELNLCFVKTKDTGIICGHDYCNRRCAWLTDAVNYVARSQSIWKFVWRDNWGQYMFKKRNEKGERYGARHIPGR